MQDTDGFIDEVNEALRRERLFGVMKRYAWVAVLAVLLIVGGAAWREYSVARKQAQAEAFGDALTALLAQPADARLASLDALDVPASGAEIVGLFKGDAQAEVGEISAALESYAAIRDAGGVYGDLARLKAVQLQIAQFGGGEMPSEINASLRAELAPIRTPGHPLRGLAAEQEALLLLRAGERDAAITLLQTTINGAQVEPATARGLTELLIALGGRL